MRRPAREGPKPYDGRACAGEVGLRRSTCEPPEQDCASCYGGWGGKGAAGGEHHAGAHAPTLSGICMSQRLDGVHDANRGPGLLSRHSSFRRAVCVDALARICAGAACEGRPYRDTYTSFCITPHNRPVSGTHPASNTNPRTPPRPPQMNPVKKTHPNLQRITHVRSTIISECDSWPHAGSKSATDATSFHCQLPAFHGALSFNPCICLTLRKSHQNRALTPSLRRLCGNLQCSDDFTAHPSR